MPKYSRHVDPSELPEVKPADKKPKVKKAAEKTSTKKKISEVLKEADSAS